MKRELKNAVSRTAFIAFVYLFVIGICILFLKCARDTEGTMDLSDWLGNYQNQEELQELYKQYIDSIDGYIELYKKNNYDTSFIVNQRYVFEYAIEHELSAKEATVYAETSPFVGKDRVSVLLSTDLIVLMVMLIACCFFSDLLVTSDFTYKTHRFLYAGQKRVRILCDKAAAYGVLVFGTFIVVQSICFLFGEVFASPVREILYINGTVVTGRSPIMACFLEALSVLVQIIPFSIAFFFVNVLTRNSIVAVLLNIGLFLVVFYCCQEMHNTICANIGTSPVYTVLFLHPEEVNLSSWLVSYGSELAIVTLLSLVSIKRFVKSDFL
ncbi:MAG: hypothetical protein IJM57_05330 [Lachnospiraceae bacterium]|nr:hypothetical protein [Lachnospiraceae bacterium]